VSIALAYQSAANKAGGVTMEKTAICHQYLETAARMTKHRGIAPFVRRHRRAGALALRCHAHR
jgi:hypothetical protein